MKAQARGLPELLCKMARRESDSEAYFAERRCDFKVGIDILYKMFEDPSVEHAPIGMPVWSSTARECHEPQNELPARFVFTPCGTSISEITRREIRHAPCEFHIFRCEQRPYLNERIRAFGGSDLRFLCRGNHQVIEIAGRMGLPEKCVVFVISGKKIDGSSGELITTLGGLGQPADRSPAGLDIRQVVRHVSAVNNNICCGWSVMPTAEPRVVRAEHESKRFNLLTPWIYSRMTTLYSGRSLFRCISPHGAYSRRLGTLGHSFLEFSPTP